MADNAGPTPPSVFWAQKKSYLYLRFELANCKEPTIKTTPTSVYFRGSGGTDNKEHEVTIDLYCQITQVRVQLTTNRATEIFLRKKIPQVWPQLTKCYDWLKVDSEIWTDEDEGDAEGGPNDTDTQVMMRHMKDLIDANQTSIEDGEYSCVVIVS